MMFSIEWLNQVLIQNYVNFCQLHFQDLALPWNLTVLCEDIRVDFS